MHEQRTVIIIGGVAGGASCAARLRRLDEYARIIMVERGAHVSFANCGLPYYVGDVIQDESRLLVASAELFRTRFNIDVRPNTEALAIDRQARRVHLKNEEGLEYGETYDYLVLSPGAVPIRPPLPGIELPGIFCIRTVPDSRNIRAWIEERRIEHAVVVGGGFIGLEMTENLVHRGIIVQLIEMAAQLMPAFDPEIAIQMQRRLETRGAAVHLGDPVSAFRSDRERLCVVSRGGAQFVTDMVILALGVRPENSLAKQCGLSLGPRGHIIVDERMRTEDARIFAIGDAVEVRNVVTDLQTAVPLAGPANRQGRLAADVICGRDRRFRGVQGTAVCGAFGLTMACTGINERTLLEAQIEHYDAIYLHPSDHVGYFPGAKTMHLKLLYRRDDGRILGAQAIGEAGVERRIDVIAMAMQMKGTVFDLEEAELCYAPQYGAAKDPVNMAGMIGANAVRGDTVVESWAQTLLITHLFAPGLRGDIEIKPWTEISREHCCVLDVREPHEFARGHMPGAVNIPLPRVRSRLAEIPRTCPVLVTCTVGQRAYNAVRILRQHDYDARLLSGGYLTYVDSRDSGRIS